MRVALYGRMTPPVAESAEADRHRYILPIRASSPTSRASFVGVPAMAVRRAPRRSSSTGPPPRSSRRTPRAWGALVRHVPPSRASSPPMGKVGGVLTGVRLAPRDEADRRGRRRALRRAHAAPRSRTRSTSADVVRPQNYFDPLPWHARWDTGAHAAQPRRGRRLAGDARRSPLAADRRRGRLRRPRDVREPRAVRTVVAAGGREAVLSTSFVPRRPCDRAALLVAAGAPGVRRARAPGAAGVAARRAAGGPSPARAPDAGGCSPRAAPAAVAAVAGGSARRRGGGRACFPASTPLLRAGLGRRARGLRWLAVGRASCSWRRPLPRPVSCGTPLRRCACCGARFRAAPTARADREHHTHDVDRLEAAVVRQLGRARGDADDQVHLGAQHESSRPAASAAAGIRPPDGAARRRS